MRGEDEGPLDEYVGQPGECPPAHEQTVSLLDNLPHLPAGNGMS
jgi:hypothetical protein